MNKIQFEILRYLYEKQEVDLNMLALNLYKDIDEISDALANLRSEDFINGMQLTSKGIDLLNQHRVDNAVILAAGTSSRFVPLNYELPKGLLMVRGERLIERQITQLREKGITDIIIVVGYMKERFEYLVEKYNVRLVEALDFNIRNNYSSLYAARNFLKNTIVTSSDLYFSENLFQLYAYDSYYCTVYISGKTAERGIETDADDRIIETFYGDRCHDIWVTLGYAFFSDRFSQKILDIIASEYDLPSTQNKFWADIQDAHLDELYMYAKRCENNIIHEFDSLEELREFDSKYLYDSGSFIMKQLCYQLAVQEKNIIGLTSLKKVKPSMFRFRCKGDTYICDVNPDGKEKLTYDGRAYYLCRDSRDNQISLFKMEKNIRIGGYCKVNVEHELDQLYSYTSDFIEYHKRALPLCAAENVISPFASLPLRCGFQERYIMNNTYSFNMDDNFIGCEKLFPFYQKISDTCERIFNAKYTDPRPFTGMHCIDMITKTICKPGERMIILDKAHGGHASVKPVVERLGIETFSAPYDLDENDLDYTQLNRMVKDKSINYILLAPSDLIKPLDVEKIDTSNCVLLWDCSQIMGLIAAHMCTNPLESMKNVVMFGGTHKTFPGPASGLILTNDKNLHDLMEREINPKYLRNSQMHQKICLLFALLEFEQYGAAYMSHMVHCSNYLGAKLRDAGYDVADVKGQISSTHQIFIRCSKEEMDTIYDNAYKCAVTLNKKHKELFYGYGIRLGTQEIARYDWNDSTLDIIADILIKLSDHALDVKSVISQIASLPEKKIHYAFPENIVKKFEEMML